MATTNQGKTSKRTTTTVSRAQEKVLPFMPDNTDNPSIARLAKYNEDYPTSHPFHQSKHAFLAEQEVAECKQAFQATVVRHQFTFVSFGVQAVLLCLPITAMFVFQHQDAIREMTGGRYHVDFALFAVGLALFGGMHYKNNFRERPKTVTVLFLAFLAVEALLFSFLYYHGDQLVYKTVLTVLMDVELLFLGGMVFCLQCRLDFFSGAVSHLLKAFLVVAGTAGFACFLVFVLDWIPPVFTIYASIGFFYIIVFTWYYTETFVHGKHRVGPNSYVYSSTKSYSYVLLYLSIIAMGFHAKYYMNEGKMSTENG